MIGLGEALARLVSCGRVTRVGPHISQQCEAAPIDPAALAEIAAEGVEVVTAETWEAWRDMGGEG